MKIHYFQRYHSKENVDTANAMLLLSRLYSFSSKKFFDFLTSLLPENVNVEINFALQEKSLNSVLDASIAQPSFKIAIETKLYSNFSIKQIKAHLESFDSEDYKVLLTLDPGKLGNEMQDKINEVITEYNKNNEQNVIHRHLTFEELSKSIDLVLNEQDYEMKNVLEDYNEYCYDSNLIVNDWKIMRVQLCGATLDANKRLNLYYHESTRGYSGHQYIGLYKEKAVRAIGKIVAIVDAKLVDENIVITKIKYGECTESMKASIKEAIEDAKNYGYNLETIEHTYFFVDKFYDTLFEKTTPYPPRGTRIFDLCEVLEVNKLPDNVEAIADKLRDKKW